MQESITQREIPKRAITQREIAKKANISQSIVSRILSNAPDLSISQETRDKVLEIAKKFSYKPKLIIQRHHNIVIGLYSLNYIGGDFFSPIIAGIAYQTSAFDFDLQFLSTNPSLANTDPELYFLNRPLYRNVKGYIIIDQSVSDKEIIKLRNGGMPVVLINREIPDSDIPCVLLDEEKTMYDLTSYLINKGHKGLALIITSLKWDQDKRKLNGLKKAFEDKGLQFSQAAQVIESGFWRTMDKNDVVFTNKVLTLLNKTNRPTAIITDHDKTAARVIQIAQEKGLRIPEDLAVAGHHNTDIATIYPITLTSTKVPLREMGEKAIMLLESLIEDRKIDNKRIVLQQEIILRESTESLR